ncbi:MAG: hypothetical protein R2734_15590 [Nocardioides sp.]
MTTTAPTSSAQRTAVLSARGLVKTFGKVVGLDGVDPDLYPVRCSPSSATTAPASPRSSSA